MKDRQAEEMPGGLSVLKKVTYGWPFSRIKAYCEVLKLARHRMENSAPVIVPVSERVPIDVPDTKRTLMTIAVITPVRSLEVTISLRPFLGG